MTTRTSRRLLVASIIAAGLVTGSAPWGTSQVASAQAQWGTIRLGFPAFPTDNGNVP